MRTIKFRAWMTFEEKMDYSPAITFWSEQPEDPIEVNGYSTLPDEEDGEIAVHLMQFTGLLDKNGKEIYEGDILKHSFSPGREEIIVISPIGTLIDLLISLRNWSGRLRDLNDKVEVIGNIYEHPNLIKN